MKAKIYVLPKIASGREAKALLYNLFDITPLLMLFPPTFHLNVILFMRRI
jgi:hypothetical protein